MLGSLLASALGGATPASLKDTSGSASGKPKLGADAILERLQTTRSLYDLGNPYAVGDLVTPRADGNCRGAGEPCIVIESLEFEPILIRSPDVDPQVTGASVYGRRLDIRVARYSDECFVTFMDESQNFEAWTPEHEAAWREKLAKEAAGPQPMTLAEALAALRDRAAGKEVKAEWKEGDTVEIIPAPRGAEVPMAVEGVHVGIVQRVDNSDGTSNVLYHSASSGRIGAAWIRNVDLRKWGPKPAPSSLPAVEPAPSL